MELTGTIHEIVRTNCDEITSVVIRKLLKLFKKINKMGDEVEFNRLLIIIIPYKYYSESIIIKTALQ